MTTKYFRNFENVRYRFGDNESPVLFNNLTAYTDILDQLKDNVSLYNKYTIVSGERPDTLSYKLYGTTDFYWTFYILNDHIRLSGWPLPDFELLYIAKSKYPHRTIVTNTNFANLFPIGQVVTGQQSNTSGAVIAKRPDFGQIIIETTDSFTVGESVQYRDTDNNFQSVVVVTDTLQFNAIHHYEDSDAVYQDLTLFDFNNPGATLTPITFRDRLETRNEELKEIIVLRPGVVTQVASEFNKLHQQRF